jgi:diguanylate cyclase (GGDEF)-like protein/PAS domain S-box-containing protein
LHDKPAAILAIGSPATVQSPVRRALGNYATLFDLSCAGSLDAARQALRSTEPELILIETELADGCSLDLVSEIGTEAASMVVLIADKHKSPVTGMAPAPYLDVLLADELSPEQLPRTLSRLLRQQLISRQCTESEQLIRRLQDNLDQTEKLGQPIFWQWDCINDRLVSCSQEYASLFEMTVEEALAHFTSESRDLSSIHSEDRIPYLEAHAASAKANGNVEAEYRILTKTGAVRYVRETSRTDYDERGNRLYEYGSLLDITATKRAEKALRDSEDRYRRLYHENPSMFFTINALGKILSVNRYGAEHLGYSVEDLIDKPLASLVYESDVALALSSIQKTLADPEKVHHWELRLVCQDGSQCWVRETARAITQASGELQVMLVCEDITETHRLSEQLSYHASHDPLTKLLNRREFDLRLKRVLDTARDENSEHALCYLDLDQFKVVNDTCGHTAGDELLRQLGDLLKNNVRTRDTLARLGGDEFGILMEHCNLQQAKRVAETLRKEIEEFRFGWEDRIFNVGVSIGLVPIASTGLNSIDVLKQADAACYAAKDAGRNRIHVYLEADSELARRHGEMQLIEQINRALAEERLELYAQTIVPVQGTSSGRAHYEVLVRMSDEAGQQIAPGAFLAAAERYGVSPRLDRHIIQRTFDHLWKNAGHLEDMALCSINLSGLSLSNTDFHEFLLGLLHRKEVPAEKICFEITETAAIANLTDATEFIRSLRDHGCRFALDDFGSGLSSFAYLKSLPVDYLKIDGFFVRDIASDPISYAMVKSIHDIGKLMGMQTIAEFVENDAIMEKLKEIGVDYAQGYGISRPRPIEQMHS